MTAHRAVLIQNKKGLHARAAAKFVKLAQQFGSEIRVRRQVEEGAAEDAASIVNARSILGLMMLGAGKGVTLDISATGSDENQAVEAIEQLVNALFEEDE